MRVLGISRSPRFSPNSTERDAAIFNLVGRRLKEDGHDVRPCSEDDILCVREELEHAELVYTMARDVRVLALLKERESDGLHIINSPASLSAYTRGSMFRMFYTKGLPVPRTYCVHPVDNITLPEELEYPLWIKRSDECAQVKSDVRLVHDEGELRMACGDYFARGIREVLLCEHIEGELIKFYGVLGTGFFYARSTDTLHGFSKFGLEHGNKVTSHLSFDKDVLKEYANRAAFLSSISVYGGDAVVCEKGLYIIDFNDWPSFSLCRDEAAAAIVKCLFTTEQ